MSKYVNIHVHFESGQRRVDYEKWMGMMEESIGGEVSVREHGGKIEVEHKIGERFRIIVHTYLVEGSTIES